MNQQQTESKGLETVKGEIEAVNNRKGQEFYGILVNGNWQNGENPMPQGLEKGVTVEIESDPEADFYNIQEINVMEQRETQNQNVGGGAISDLAQGEQGDNSQSSNTFQTQKSKDITVKVATKLAVEHANTRPEQQAEHLDEVNELASGYMSIMQGLLKEVNQGDAQ